MNTHIEQYQQNQVAGMSQRELIVMLYTGAIRFLKEAIAALHVERYDVSCAKFERSRKIVLHLYSTLNLDAGKIASDLAALYTYIIEQICVANAKREAAPAELGIELLQTVRDAWQQLPDEENITLPNGESLEPEPAEVGPTIDGTRTGLCLEV